MLKLSWHYKILRPMTDESDQIASLNNLVRGLDCLKVSLCHRRHLNWSLALQPSFTTNFLGDPLHFCGGLKRLFEVSGVKANMPRMIAMNKLYIQWFCSNGIVQLVSKQTILRIAYVTGAVEHSSTIKKLKWFRFRSQKNCNRINQNLLLFVFEFFVRWSFPTYLRLMPGGN